MDEHGIRHLDMLPALERAVARGEAIFPTNVDGHFTADGYRLIAHEVARRLDGAGP
jgi:lysophospholipase L1-like esterase